jgi:predicted metal-dependent hydrolase
VKKIIETPSFNYSIRRSQRAKKTRIIVSPEKIEVVAPNRVSSKKIHVFVLSQQEWVVSAQQKIKEKHPIKSKAPKKYEDGVEIFCRGKKTIIKIKTTSFNKLCIEAGQEPQQIIVNVPSIIDEKDQGEWVKASLISWMKIQAENEVMKCVELHAGKFQLYPRFIRVKTQKSRWGSCGIHNDININWLLILAPPQVMEYVVVHEICHIKERNHSARFWDLVEAHLPEYKTQRLWLKKEGGNLMREFL